MTDLSSDPAIRDGQLRALAGITDQPTRPTPSHVGQSAAYHENYDRERVTLGVALAAPHVWQSASAKAAADAFTRTAGLAGGVDALLAAGGWPAELEKPWATAHGKQVDPAFHITASPLRLRAWAVQFAPSLIDPAAPKPSGAAWW